MFKSIHGLVTFSHESQISLGDSMMNTYANNILYFCIEFKKV